MYEYNHLCVHQFCAALSIAVFLTDVRINFLRVSVSSQSISKRGSVNGNSGQQATVHTVIFWLIALVDDSISNLEGFVNEELVLVPTDQSGRAWLCR